MEPRVFVRTGAGIVAGLALFSTIAACGADDGPTDPGGGENAPTLTSITPSSGAVGPRARTVDVSLTGTGFDRGGLEVSVSGSGVVVANVSVVSATSLTADFIIAGESTTGDRSVTVSTDDGTSGSVAFRVRRDRGGAEAHVIEIYDNYPAPTFLEIEVGGTVRWRNVGHNDHTVMTYGTPGEWETALLEPNASFHHTFYEAGEYGYICSLHQAIGFVTVVEAGTMMMDP